MDPDVSRIENANNHQHDRLFLNVFDGIIVILMFFSAKH